MYLFILKESSFQRVILTGMFEISEVRLTEEHVVIYNHLMYLYQSKKPLYYEL